MNIIGHKRIFLGFSGALVILGIAAIAVLGFKPGIEFTGGTLWQVAIPGEAASRDTLEAFVRDELALENAAVTSQSEAGRFLIRSQEITEVDHQAYREQLNAKFGAAEELSFQTIGASIGSELRRKAFTAFALVILGISLYIAFAFRKVSHPVQSWKYGLITLGTLAHDTIIPAGLFAALGRFAGVEIDINFLVALLLVMGFSVHDTIVVFDRIRENLKSRIHADQRGTNQGKQASFGDLVNVSVNQTFARSVNTSLTLVLVLLAVFFFGAPTLHYFVLAILVGVVFGTYSSIFVASPLLTLWQKRGG